MLEYDFMIRLNTKRTFDHVVLCVFFHLISKNGLNKIGKEQFLQKLFKPQGFSFRFMKYGLSC